MMTIHITLVIVVETIIVRKNILSIIYTMMHVIIPMYNKIKH